jgi:outer membrane protein
MNITTTTYGISFIILLLTMQVFPARGQATRLSLHQARDFALEHSRTMQSARADLRIARASAREITGTGLPQVSASAGYQWFLDIPTSLIPAEFFGGEPGQYQEVRFGTEHNLTATATVTQMVFDGSYIVGLRASKIYRQLSRENLQRTELDVVNTVTETYLLALISRDNIHIVGENLSNMRKTLHETEQIFKAGFTDEINVDQLRLTVSNMENTLRNLHRQSQLMLDMLKFQIGMELLIEVELSDSLEGLLEELTLEIGAAEDFDPREHIDYKAALSAENFSHMVMLREQSAYLPTINASFTRQEMAMRNEFNFFQGDRPWFPATIFSVNINIPIFSSGLRSSRVQQARLELEKSRLASISVSQALIMEMNQSRAAFSTALEQYNDSRENLELARRILNRTTIMQREGLASSLELTQANEQLLTTEASYLNSIFELLNARNNLNRALGKY